MSKTKETVPGTLVGPSSLDAWREAGVHLAQLETGAWVKFRFPDLSELAAAGKVPEELKAIALARIARELKLLLEPGEELPEDAEATMDQEKMAANAELNYWLLSQMLVEPEISPEEAASLPTEDRTLLIDLAERTRDTDARGVVMGVVPQSWGAAFREAHRCGPDCEGCLELRRRRSSALASIPGLPV
jgi:hypothetical protein